VWSGIEAGVLGVNESRADARVLLIRLYTKIVSRSNGGMRASPSMIVATSQ
jgi:hypothetical protein